MATAYTYSSLMIRTSNNLSEHC